MKRRHKAIVLDIAAVTKAQAGVFAAALIKTSGVQHSRRQVTKPIMVLKRQAVDDVRLHCSDCAHPM